MGTTHSIKQVKAGEDTTSPAPPGICCPLPGFVAKMQRLLLRKLNISARKQKRLRRLNLNSQSRSHLLRPMPRCSSFGSCGNLLTPPPPPASATKKSGDRQYAQWKCSFEQRLHDISEAFVGQTTPRGFPSHTDAQRCRQLPEKKGKQLLAEAEEEDQLTVPESPLYDMVGGMKLRRRLSLKTSGSSSGSYTLGRRPSARQKAAQARLEAQFQRDLCDLEEYYGGFHFAQHSDRLARF